MSEEEDRKEAARGIWSQRGWRFVTALNVFLSILFAFVLLGMVNYLAYRHGPERLHIGSSNCYALSDKTRGLLESLDGEVHISSFFERTHGLYGHVRLLLKEYEYVCAAAGNDALKIEYVDPDRDLGRTKELRRKYGIEEPNLVVFEYKGRSKFVEIDDIIETTPEVDINKLLTGGKSAFKRKVAFMGEMAFSSAIQSITQSATPVVYFLTGHGERDMQDFSQHVGYSGIAVALRRDNMILKVLSLAEHRSVPEDCSVLVVAGPDRQLSRAEVDMISSYLDRSGRALFLMDPATQTGLDTLLNKWGVRLSRGVVVGLTLRGRELVVTQYGDHPITRKMKGLMTMFYMPRCVEPVEAALQDNEQVDRPRVTVLAANSKDGWEEMNLNQTPPKYEEGLDVPGPNAVAVAVEKGTVAGIDIELKPTRMVVIGDSDFVSNGTLKGGIGGNMDFFMSAMNWLVEREAILAIAPRTPDRLELGMTQEQKRIAFAILVLGVPVAAAFLGFVVWLRRRR